MSGPAGLSPGCGIGQSGFQCCKFTDYFRDGGRSGAKIITKCHDKVDKWAKCTHWVDFMRSTPRDYDVSNCQRSFVVLFSRLAHTLSFSSLSLTLSFSRLSLTFSFSLSLSLVFQSLTLSRLAGARQAFGPLHLCCDSGSVFWPETQNRSPNAVHLSLACGCKDSDFF